MFYYSSLSGSVLYSTALLPSHFSCMSSGTSDHLDNSPFPCGTTLSKHRSGERCFKILQKYATCSKFGQAASTCCSLPDQTILSFRSLK